MEEGHINNVKPKEHRRCSLTKFALSTLDKHSENDIEKGTDDKEDICGLCLDDVKGKSDLDVECHRCHFRVCYECMFEYIRFNKKKDALLCPHCRQDLLDNLNLLIDK